MRTFLSYTLLGALLCGCTANSDAWWDSLPYAQATPTDTDCSDSVSDCPVGSHEHGGAGHGHR